MKSILAKAVLGTLLAGGCVAAYAAGPFVGLNYSQYELDIDAADESLTPTGATVRAGAEFNDLFALEVRAGTGIESDQRSSGLGTAEFEVDRLYGGYFRLSVPVADLFRPYAIVGYSESRGTTSIRSGGALVSRSTDTVGDQSYGVGVDASLAGAIGFNVEYMRYLDKDDYDLNAISVGIRSGF
ncbi:MAG: porin family protein [Alcanivoracaceae bacterium]|nr:porin family protein [Alcanivoracaceae bacterium]